MVRIRPPLLPIDFVWVNVLEPLSLRQLKGRVVLLDFWTHGCINCIHMMPTLKFIEQTYADQVTVIGIHAGKFSHEQTLSSIEQAIKRFDISHPVLIDQDFQLWQAYTVKAWPTLILIDTAGYIVHHISGECDRNYLCRLINPLLPPSPSPTSPSSPTFPTDSSTSLLNFPTKLLATADTLFITDSGHHRIVVTTPQGQPKQLIGQGTAGLADGNFQTAQFNQPQGMAWDTDTRKLYVADAGNHCIRQIDFSRQTVLTLAGDGTQGRTLFPHGGIGTQIPLNSPWDIVLIKDKLYIAMAGNHQIWQMDLLSLQLQTYFGTGAEGCVDGDRTVAAFAQPSGLATDGQRLYVVDSETSCVRAITLDNDPIVKTLCGSGELFGYGDRDGMGESVRLQHPMDIALDPDQESLWIADTYNGKIKLLNLNTLACRTYFEDLAEPNGINTLGDRLYIANTNHHTIEIAQQDLICSLLIAS